MSDEDLLLSDPRLTFGSGVVGVCDVCGKRQAVIILQKERFKLCVLDFLNKAWKESKATPGRPLPLYRSERVWFETDASPTGKAQGVVLTPTKPVRHPTVLVTPDVYGLTTMVLDAGVRFAREGYEVMLPDLGKLDGLSPFDHLGLRTDVRFRGGVRMGSARVRKLVELYTDALAHLRDRPMVDAQKTAVFGASYGASLAVGVAGEDRALSAVALAFPAPIVPPEYLRLLNVPVLFLAGDRDPLADRARAQLERFLPPPAEVHYRQYARVGPLFLARDLRAYDLVRAEAAWTEVLTFFRDRLMPPPPKPPAPPAPSASRPAPPVPASGGSSVLPTPPVRPAPSG